jgi:hypothetical protein
MHGVCQDGVQAQFEAPARFEHLRQEWSIYYIVIPSYNSHFFIRHNKTPPTSSHTIKMVHLISLIPALLLVTSVSAFPLLEERAATTCGSTSYTATQVNQAAQKACSYYTAGTTTNSYPHTYNNYEGFTFTVAGPYLEFPMLSSGVYTGGK